MDEEEREAEGDDQVEDAEPLAVRRRQTHGGWSDDEEMMKMLLIQPQSKLNLQMKRHQYTANQQD